jgi:hypothetical protein
MQDVIHSLRHVLSRVVYQDLHSARLWAESARLVAGARHITYMTGDKVSHATAPGQPMTITMQPRPNTGGYRRVDSLPDVPVYGDPETRQVAVLPQLFRRDDSAALARLSPSVLYDGIEFDGRWSQLARLPEICTRDAGLNGMSISHFKPRQSSMEVQRKIQSHRAS